MRALEAKAKTSISPPGLRLAADAIARPAASHALPSPSRPSPTLDTRVLALEVGREGHYLNGSKGVLDETCICPTNCARFRL